MNISPARWSVRSWIAAFAIPGTLALTLAACAPTAPTPTLEDAYEACLMYGITEEGASGTVADEACTTILEDKGKDAFIELWSD